MTYFDTWLQTLSEQDHRDVVENPELLRLLRLAYDAGWADMNKTVSVEIIVKAADKLAHLAATRQSAV